MHYVSRSISKSQQALLEEINSSQYTAVPAVQVESRWNLDSFIGIKALGLQAETPEQFAFVKQKIAEKYAGQATALEVSNASSHISIVDTEWNGHVTPAELKNALDGIRLFVPDEKEFTIVLSPDINDESFQTIAPMAIPTPLIVSWQDDLQLLANACKAYETYHKEAVDDKFLKDMIHAYYLPENDPKKSLETLVLDRKANVGNYSYKRDQVFPLVDSEISFEETVNNAQEALSRLEKNNYPDRLHNVTLGDSLHEKDINIWGVIGTACVATATAASLVSGVIGRPNISLLTGGIAGTAAVVGVLGIRNKTELYTEQTLGAYTWTIKNETDSLKEFWQSHDPASVAVHAATVETLLNEGAIFPTDEHSLHGLLAQGNQWPISRVLQGSIQETVLQACKPDIEAAYEELLSLAQHYSGTAEK